MPPSQDDTLLNANLFPLSRRIVYLLEELEAAPDLYGCEELAVGDLPDVDVAEDGGDDAVAAPGEVSTGEYQLPVVALGQSELFGYLHNATHYITTAHKGVGWLGFE